MFRQMMKSKIHRAIVTEADLDYVGSVTIDRDIMDAVDLLPNEKVQIVDNTNGARIETYAIPGERGSGTIGINGAAAHLIHPGDTVIIIAYSFVAEERVREHQPRIAIMNPDNTIKQLIAEEEHAAVLP